MTTAAATVKRRVHRVFVERFSSLYESQVETHTVVEPHTRAWKKKRSSLTYLILLSQLFEGKKITYCQRKLNATFFFFFFFLRERKCTLV